MLLNKDGKNPADLSTSNAVLFQSSKSYYYAGFNDNEIQTCKMDGKDAATTPVAPVTENPDKPSNRPTGDPCQIDTPSTHELKFMSRDDPKMNSMTLLVTGLRILLAKCVAVNVLMTVKAFLF